MRPLSGIDQTAAPAGRLVLAALLATCSFAAQAIDFNGTVDNNWFDAGNWSSGTVPTPSDPVRIPPGQSVTALAADGVQADSEELRINHDVGAGASSMYSQVPLVSTDWVRVGGGRFQTGDFTGVLEMDGAPLTAVELLICEVSNPGVSGQGSVTISGGSLNVSDAIRAGYVFQGGGSGLGSLTVVDGDIIGAGASLEVGHIYQASPGPSNGFFELRNGALSGFTTAGIGRASDDGTGGALAGALFADASADFSSSFSVALGTESTATLELDNSYLAAGSLFFGGNSTTTFHIDGATRASAGSVGTPGQYSAIDVIATVRGLADATIEPGAMLRLDFSYQPTIVTAYDLIRLPVGQTFNGTDFTSFEVIGTNPSLISSEIIPGTASSGEILRVTHPGEAIFSDAFLAPPLPGQM